LNDLSNPATIRALLARHNFKFTKALGQNFLINPSVCPRMAEACFSENAGGAVEIGAGIGILTRELCKTFPKVLSFEIDNALMPILNETLAGFGNVEIINADVLKTDLAELLLEKFGGKPASVCANLPYYITSPVIMFLLESGLNLENITVMIQREVADRLCAEVGSPLSGAITAAVHYYAVPEKLFRVSSGSFMPPPKVDSTVIRLNIRRAPPVEVADEEAFFRLIRAAFSQRRKTAVNSLSAGLGLPKETVAHALDSCGFEQNIRAERFSLEDFARLADTLNMYGQTQS